jgi:hypothetical protein
LIFFSHKQSFAVDSWKGNNENPGKFFFLLLNISLCLLLTSFYLFDFEQSEHSLLATQNMFFLLINYFFLSMIHAIVITEIHRSAIYNPILPSALLRSASLPPDASIQSCIWECDYEDNCQTAVYYFDTKVCSMFDEFCQSSSIQTSGNLRASVICYRKNQGKFIFYFHSKESFC